MKTLTDIINSKKTLVNLFFTGVLTLKATEAAEAQCQNINSFGSFGVSRSGLGNQIVLVNDQPTRRNPRRTYSSAGALLGYDRFGAGDGGYDCGCSDDEYYDSDDDMIRRETGFLTTGSRRNTCAFCKPRREIPRAFDEDFLGRGELGGTGDFDDDAPGGIGGENGIGEAECCLRNREDIENLTDRIERY